jgi:hypothetical protein
MNMYAIILCDRISPADESPAIPTHYSDLFSLVNLRKDKIIKGKKTKATISPIVPRTKSSSALYGA